MSGVSTAGRGPQAFDRGSFRDRTARVFYREGRVLRALTPAALADWESVSSARFFNEAMAAGRIVRTAPWTGDSPVQVLANGQPCAATLEHERVPFVSYPYEWSFGMLRDAALLQLDLLHAALEEGFTLKDATPFNVQWNGAAPVFIDIPSFHRLAAGEPWAGYRQFCELFLFPLFLQAYKQLPFHPWLRGSIDGVTPEQCRRLMSFRDLFRRGVLTHVHIHARAQARYGQTDTDVRATLRSAGFGAELIKANVRSLRRLVRRLDWRPAHSVWSAYADCNRYEEADAGRKRAFVERALAGGRRALVWDLGCNTGVFSRMAAAHADHVVAMDSDHAVVERLYIGLKRDGPKNVLPLCVNLADPSPGLGWRGQERLPLEARGRPDLALALALVHHLAIGANVPLGDVVGWLADLGGDLVVEFVTRQDPMVQVLLRNRDDHYGDYDLAVFERLLGERLHVVSREEICDGARVLYFARQPTRP